MLDKSYSPALIVLSVIVATLGAYVAVEIAQRVRTTTGRSHFLWTSGGALAMGFGIWSMHFVGMLALHLRVLVWYDIIRIAASVVAAVVGCAIAFVIFNRPRVNSWTLALASVFMGLAIAGMHYIGMAGMRLDAHVIYDPLIVAASVGVAITVSFAALAVTRNLIETTAEAGKVLKKAGASVLMGLAVAGMHYTGMAAAHFSPVPSDLRVTDSIVLGSYQLGLIVALTSVSLFAIALVATQFERWTATTRNRFDNLLELSPQIVWFARPDGYVEHWNPYWYEYTGLSEKSSHGHAWTNAIHPDDRDSVVGTWEEAVRKGADYEVELRLRAKSGDYCWFLARGRPGRDATGNVNAWLGIAVDIEERKKAEEEAWAASQAKSEFLASMSHELRTPLNAIGGYAELLAMGIRGPLNADQAQDIARIRRSQQHLLTLINDVLNFAKVDAGQTEYHITAVPVDEALHDTETMIAPQIMKKGLRYIREGADKTNAVLADPEKMQQIVLNLLSNAVKFTDEGGSITLSSGVAGKCIEIRVADTGPGISPEKLEKIFDPFVQVDRRLNQPVPGVGLGLAISRDLAHAMNGEISVESVVGKGTTFTLSLPRAPRMELADFAPVQEAEVAVTAGAIPATTPVLQLADGAPKERSHPERPKDHSDDDQRRYHDA